MSKVNGMLPFMGIGSEIKTYLDNSFTSLISNDIGRIAAIIAILFSALTIARALLAVLNFIFVYFIRPGKNLRKYGAWAVVTGATDGIGKAYAIELAKNGIDLVVISRTQSKLDDLSTELRSTYSVNVKTCAADLTKIDSTTASCIGASLKDLDIGILVNNAGMSYNFPEFLEIEDATTDIDMININVTALTLITKLVLPGMKQRRRGAIVNLGSGNGLLPAVPLLDVYAGTKAYVNQFTRSLNEELKPFNITVHDQCPLFVATKMTRMKPRLDAPTPEVWAAAAIKQIGYDVVRSPYWHHGLTLGLVASVLPTSLVAGHVHKLHLKFNRLKKKRMAQAAAAAAESKKDS